jgi:sulfatase maturation enzyme AslB (radical SAM superfamily)
VIKSNIKNPKNLKQYQIHQIQLDPYGVCNARCWFCPVAYGGNPKDGKEVMPIDLLEKIISNIVSERNRNGLVNKTFKTFYTAHYNEILLYPHFEEFLKLCKKYGLSFVLLSNGIPLSKEKVDLIKQYGVVAKITLNIPAFDAETWSKRVGINIKQFDKLIENVNYARKELFGLVRNGLFEIQINGVDKNSYWITKGENFPKDLFDDELEKQTIKAHQLFSNLKIIIDNNLVDRVGLLDNVFSNKPTILSKLQKEDENKKVIGCNIGAEIGGRALGWLHINSKGETFLCCNDFHFEHKFGDFKTQTLEQLWGTDIHIEMVENAFKTICRNCSAAIFE